MYILSMNYTWEYKDKRMHFHYIAYMPRPSKLTPAPGGHEIHNLGRLSIGYHYKILTLSDLSE